jgi:hypothetical protein
MFITVALVAVTTTHSEALEFPKEVARLVQDACFDCHSGADPEGGLNLSTLSRDLSDRETRVRWIQIYDRVDKREMPPNPDDLAPDLRGSLVRLLRRPLALAERAEVLREGRGPIRRLNRDEFQQNLRDLLQLPHLDIRDMLPEDRRRHHFDKVSDSLDMSRVQLIAYLDATEAALRSAMATTDTAPAVTKRRVVGRQLSAHQSIAGGRQSMFFVRNSKGIDLQDPPPPEQPDPTVEMALFRSPGWPYSIFPKNTVAPVTGDYQVRFSARAVVQLQDYVLKPATASVPMTFRARRPTNHDIAEDVRPTGGLFDITPEEEVYETTVYLLASQTIEYGLLGLPNPQIDAQGRTGYYRYPPIPKGGQPGIAFRWLEMEGPLPPADWPPASHRVLFDDFDVAVRSAQPRQDALRLIRRFIHLAARQPVPADAMVPFENLVESKLSEGQSLADALLIGYQAFLCSDRFLFLHEPKRPDDQFAVANRLSHFLGDSRPDDQLIRLAGNGQLHDSATLLRESGRLIASQGFDRFVRHFTDSWLELRELRREPPDIRLYPEYRLDDYLVESAARETRAFFAAMIRDNLPASSLIDSDFAYANDRLARHYGLPEIHGSKLRRVSLPADSPYGGLLTQASVLKVSANGTSTSPVLRGAWVMDRLLGAPPPPPPPGVPAIEPDIRGAETIRDQLALHTQSRKCARCHAKFDPVGFGLENFDVMGAWRTHYRGLNEGERVTGIDRAGHDYAYTIANAIDSSGTLVDGRRFKDIHELKSQLVANTRPLAKNLLHQFTVYATGTAVRFSDRVEIEKILDGCRDNGFRVRDLLISLIQSPIFVGYSEGDAL